MTKESTKDKTLITNKEVEEILKEEKINKDDYVKALLSGELKPLVYHEGEKKLMPFRVTKHYPNGMIEGYFIHEMN